MENVESKISFGLDFARDDGEYNYSFDANGSQIN